jgi:hypothetical protein
LPPSRYRLVQARELIQVVRVPSGLKGSQADIRAFQCVRRPDGPAYEPSAEVALDPFARMLVLGDMEREWKSLKKRYSHFREFTDMVRKDPDVA